MRYSMIILALLLAATVARASEEEFLIWSEVRIVGAANPDVGRVVFTAQVQEDRWREVQIEVLGKKFLLDEKQCEKFAGFPLSGIRTTHEAGYEQLGGRTVHFKFKKLLYRDDKVVESEIIVSVSRGKGLQVGEVRETVMKKA